MPRLERFTLAYLPEGPVIDWTGDIGAWLDPLAAYLKARGAFAIRLGPPVRTDSWSSAQVKQGIADPGITRLMDLPSHESDEVGARVTSQLTAAGWLPQSPDHGFGTGHPQFTYELPLAGRTEDDLLAGMNQQWRRNLKKAAKAGVEVSVGDDLKAFHDLYVHTAERDRFTPRPLRYFETMFAALNAEDTGRIRLHLARHEGTLVAAAIMVRVGTRAWYAYGASVHREAGGPRLERVPVGDDPRRACGRLRRLQPARDHPDARHHRPARRPRPVQGRHRRRGRPVRRRVGRALAAGALSRVRPLHAAARALAAEATGQVTQHRDDQGGQHDAGDEDQDDEAEQDAQRLFPCRVRSTNRSSTSPSGSPAAAIIRGYRLYDVRPGRVLTSLSTTVPSGLRNMSTRARPLQPSAR